ncbi:hypothetical protein M0805_001826 [Coniferiporia weirii]|nr:hypothetical protein M0805_001826 [Coniferiporia weirii]
MAYSPSGLPAPPPTMATATTSKDMANDSLGYPSTAIPCENDRSSSKPFLGDSLPVASPDPLDLLTDPGGNDNLDFWNGNSSTKESSLTSSMLPPSQDGPAGDWSTTGFEGFNDPTIALWAQPDLSTISFNDFSAMDLMDFDPTSLNLPLTFDPMLFSDEALGLSLDSTASSQNGAPHADLSSSVFTFDTEGVTSLNVSPPDSGGRQPNVNSLLPPCEVSLFPAMDGVRAPPASGPAQVAVPSAGKPQHSDDRAAYEPMQLATQAISVTNALPANTDTANEKYKYPGKLPIPRLHTVPSTSKSGKRGPSVASPSASSSSSAVIPAPTTSRTKIPHATVERRYRTNVNGHLQNLRTVVPALRVLEHKPGNRVCNLPLKAGTRRAGVDMDVGTAGEEEDVIDERGFIDGVRVARKGSKGNVLAKAVEYIRVLKRRELRLKREQEGLKALVRSLANGPALVKEWEAMWRERFGGPEKDEVEGEDGETDDENDGCEEDDDVEDKEEGIEESGKKRKRVKVEASSSALKGRGKKVATRAIQPVPTKPTYLSSTEPARIAPLPVPAQPEKRKRGRPRKVPLPPTPVPNILIQDVSAIRREEPVTVPSTNEVEMNGAATSQGSSAASSELPTQNQPGHYLLAVFAFFSFFYSPVSFSALSWESRYATHDRANAGSVLGGYGANATNWNIASQSAIAFGWRGVVQILQIAISFLLLASVVVPWLPPVARGRIARLVSSSLRPILSVPLFSHSGAARSTHPPHPSEPEDSGKCKENVDMSTFAELLRTLKPSRTVLPALEAQVLREALGLGTGVLGLIASLTLWMRSPVKDCSRCGLGRRLAEQRAFLRLAELTALDAKASMTTRIQMYLYARKLFRLFSASAADLASVALTIQPWRPSKAIELWSLALKRAQGKGSLGSYVSKQYETFVLENMSVDEAAQRIAKMDLGSVPRVRRTQYTFSDAPDNYKDDGTHEPLSPLAILASGFVREYVREQAERVFLQTVPSDKDSQARAMCSGGVDADSNAAYFQMERVVEAGRSLNSQTAELVDLFERVCNPTSEYFTHPPTLIWDEAVGTGAGGGMRTLADAEIRALLDAIVLYRRIFRKKTLINIPAAEDGTQLAVGATLPLPCPQPPSLGPNTDSISTTLTLPPSPLRRIKALHLALRRCLNSVAFDRRAALGIARDRVLDMLAAEEAEWPVHPEC